MAVNTIKLKRLRTVELMVGGPVSCWLLLFGLLPIGILLVGTLLVFVLLLTRLPHVNYGEWMMALTVLLSTLGAAGVVTLILWAMGSSTRDLLVLFYPGTITFQDDVVSFSFFLSARRIPAADIISIRKVSYKRRTSENLLRWWIYVDYNCGKKTKHIRFDAGMLEDFTGFWSELKARNPDITYELGEQNHSEPYIL